MPVATPYDPGFFTAIEGGSLRSAERIVPLVTERFGVRSAIDVGCGRGAWTSVLLAHGIDAHGIDGEYVDRNGLLIPPARFRSHDLATGLEALIAEQRELPRVDLAVCMEVAEHLPEGVGPRLVHYLSVAGRVVLFSAAIPNQWGTNHVNEQWQSYWFDLFASHALEGFDLVRPAVWRDQSVESWYAQNTMVYVRSEDVEAFGVRDADRPGILDVVHPDMEASHIWALLEEQRKSLLLRNLVRKLPSSARQACSVRLGRLRRSTSVLTRR